MHTVNAEKIDLTDSAPTRAKTKSTRAKPASPKKASEPALDDTVKRAWIGVVSRDHVKNGVQGGFAQVCHGKDAPLKKMKVGDGFIYYSPTISFKEKSGAKNNTNDSENKLQSFTAIGNVKGEEVYPFKMSEDFIPYRRDIAYKVPCKELSFQDIKCVL